MTTAMR
jgi:vacuolar-type H+-ATPase subunit I/STV1